ncbi:MAG: FtsX-like permease family protein [Acidimicrobiia bacterium]
MGALRMYVRSLLRHKVAGTIAVALLVGIGGAAVLGAFAGARRTDSAYPRLIASERTGDLNVSTQGVGVVPAGPVRRLPHVESAEAYRMFILASRHGNAPIVYQRDLGAATALGSPSSRPLYRTDRLQVLEGRMPNPTRVDEGIVNEIFAKNTGLGVGDTYDAYLYKLQDVIPVVERAQADGRDPTDAELRPLMTPVRFHITGLARTNTDIVVNEQDSNDTVFVTPAFVRRYGSSAFIGGVSVTLHDPTKDTASFERAVRRQFPDLNLSVEATATQIATFARVVGPYGDALRLFALVAAIAGLFVVGQALARLIMSDSADLATLSALGTTRRQRVLTCSLRSVIALLGGTAIAVVAATALSPLFPVGRARDAEPAPGVRFDTPVLILGALAMVLLLLGIVAVTAYARVRRDATARERAPFAPSHLAASLARAGAPVGAVTGVRFAVQRDRRAAGSSLLGTLVGLVAAIVAITAALVFATNLNALVSSPTRYGWTWDVLIDSFNQEISPDLAHRAVADHDLAAVATGTRASLAVAGHSIPAYGFHQVKGRVALAATRGRMPRGAHEIALGAETLRAVGRSVGDTLTVPTATGASLRMKIVGQVLLPSLNVTGTTGLAEGAAVDAAAMRKLDPSASSAFFLADLAPGASIRSVAQRYGREANTFGARRPGDVLAYGHVRSTPLLLAGLLGVLGAGVLAHLLVTSIRDRRRDLAVLKTLGFTRRQVATTVAWLATTLIGLAVVVGIPFGVVAGRWMWRSFADDLGLASVVTLPVLAFVVLVGAALVLANLVAAWPARTAARTHPAVVLRSE